MYLSHYYTLPISPKSDLGGTSKRLNVTNHEITSFFKGENKKRKLYQFSEWRTYSTADNNYSKTSLSLYEKWMSIAGVYRLNVWCSYLASMKLYLNLMSSNFVLGWNWKFYFHWSPYFVTTYKTRCTLMGVHITIWFAPKKSNFGKILIVT